jgi:hypothetical protein
MITLLSSTFLRYTGKIDQDVYVGSMMIGLAEIILTSIMVFSIIEQLGA